ncbi:MAG: hypothetical protein GF350_09740 [Chitinivibrionales bacterium]|nr:hypothetical protein [Chitinivibrionales bacterium]
MHTRSFPSNSIQSCQLSVSGRILLLMLVAIIVGVVHPVRAASPDLEHTGRVQALVSERTIPSVNLDYNHEGTIEVMANGKVIALWQSSVQEGVQWGWAMSSIWDGSSWTTPRPVNMHGPSRNYTPVPFQAADGTVLATTHDREWFGGTNVYASTDYGLTWSGPNAMPSDGNSANFNTFSRPLQFPDGRIMGAVTSDNRGSLDLRTMPANNITGPWSSSAGWTTINVPDVGHLALGGTIVRLSDDYQNLAHFTWDNTGANNSYSVSTNGGSSWSGWTSSLSTNHNHATELDPHGGPLHDYIAMATAAGGRKRVSVAFAKKSDLIAGTTSPFTTYLELANKSNNANIAERTAHGIAQDSSGMLHVTICGRGAKSIEHFVIDPYVLYDNATVDKPGYITCVGAVRGVSESNGSITVSVQRVGGDKGSASVDYYTSEGDAKDGVRYESTDGSLSWSDGDMSAKGVSIPLIDDQIAQGTQTFYFHIENASGAEMGDQQTIRVDVHDDASLDGDQIADAGLVEFTSDSFYWYEDNPGGKVWVTFGRTLGPAGQLVRTPMTWETRDIGSAVAGVDYEATSETHEVIGGTRRIDPLGIPVLDNDQKDGPRSFAVDITSLEEGELGTRTTTIVTILDDEGGSGSATIAENTAAKNAVPLSLAAEMLEDKHVALRYDIPSEGLMRLEIIDARGRLMHTIAEPKTPGAYTAHWDANGASAGIYFAVLKANNSRIIRSISVVE